MEAGTDGSTGLSGATLARAATADRATEALDVETETVDIAPDRPETLSASVVVVTYDRPREVLRETLAALAAQTATSFEVLVLDNGTGWDVRALAAEYDVVTAYVGFKRNFGVNVGRNLGARLAVGDLLVFLDDDARPAADFVEAHRRVHADHDVVAARGRVRPKSSSLYGWLGPRYDVGDEVVPCPLDIEGNVSVDASVFAEVSGFDEDLYGHEGIDLTMDILERYDRSSVVYSPDPVVYHEFVGSFRELVEKKARHGHYRQRLAAERPALLDVYERYDDCEYDLPEPPLYLKVLLYGVSRASDLAALGVRRVRSFDSPTRG